MSANPWAGLRARHERGQLVATRVVRGGPAELAGVMVGDELLAIDQRRLRQPVDLDSALVTGQQQELLICRRSQLHCLSLLATPPQVERYRLKRLPDPSDGVLQRQRAWLHQHSCAVS